MTNSLPTSTASRNIFSHLILSCEHGGNRIPATYRRYFKKATAVLNTHRGLDIGALSVARQLANTLPAPLLYSDISRLLVDLNRSAHHRKLFSEYTQACNQLEREQILRDYYYPYRQILQQQIKDTITQGNTVLHLSIHSFTPVLAGQARNADIGLLYDPTRTREKSFCLSLQTQLQQGSKYIIRLNYPYRGSADGLTTWLRKQLPAKRYLGIEIEINQKWLISNNKIIGTILTNALRNTVQQAIK